MSCARLLEAIELIEKDETSEQDTPKSQLDTCSICVDPMMEAGKGTVKMKSCGHELHLFCLIQVAAHKQYKCPICRASLVSSNY